MNQNLYPHLFQPLTEVTESDWQKVININLTGIFHCMKYELLQMQKQGRGAIVNNASIGGLRMAPGFGAYGPSKAGVIAITQTAALENADKGIRVNVICPGPTPTPLNTPEKVAEFSTWFAERCAQHMDMSLPESSVEDQANAILFFAEDASAAVTGQYLIVDHGTTI